jgi:hypothetical protein
VGLFNVALIVSVLLSGVITSTAGKSLGASRLLPTIAGLLLGVTALAGCWNLVAEKHQRQLDWDNVTVRDLTDRILDTLGPTTSHRPLIRFDKGMWAVGPGLILQMARASVPFTVDANATWLFGERFLSTGNEDWLLTVCGADLHRELVKRPNNIVVAHQDSAGVFVDMVSLIDSLQYRAVTAEP